MHQIVAVVFGNLERLLLDTLIQTLRPDVNTMQYELYNNLKKSLNEFCAQTSKL